MRSSRRLRSHRPGTLRSRARERIADDRQEGLARHQRLLQARQSHAELIRLVENDPEERRRAHVPVGLKIGHRLHLLLGLPGAAGEDGAAQRVRAGLEHRPCRREVIGKAVVDEVAAAETGGEQRPAPAASSPLGALRARRSGRATRRPAPALPSAAPQRAAAKPPKGRLAFCSSSSSDFRVTGNCASAARDVTLGRVDAVEEARKRRRVRLGMGDLARQSGEKRALAQPGVAGFQRVEVGGHDH